MKDILELIVRAKISIKEDKKSEALVHLDNAADLICKGEKPALKSFTISIHEKDKDCKRNNCTAQATKELHPCPWQIEMHDNSEDYCNCCRDCKQECAHDV